MTDQRAIQLAAAEAAAAEAAEGNAAPAEWEPALTGEETGRVFSLRIPGNRLTQLREVAELLGKKPTVLMREWVIERLEQELDQELGSNGGNLATEATANAAMSPTFHYSPGLLVHGVDVMAADAIHASFNLIKYRG